MEFMMYVGILLIMFTLFGPLFFNQTININSERARLEARRVATVFEREINTAIRFGDGYKRNFTVQKSILGYNYSVVIHPDLRLLEVNWRDSMETRQLIGKDFSGSPKPGTNRIVNKNGEIIFK
jgi:hypothetical protein